MEEGGMPTEGYTPITSRKSLIQLGIVTEEEEYVSERERKLFQFGAQCAEKFARQRERIMSAQYAEKFARKKKISELKASLGLSWKSGDIYPIEFFENFPPLSR